jgi:hypothetical protein
MTMTGSLLLMNGQLFLMIIAFEVWCYVLIRAVHTALDRKRLADFVFHGDDWRSLKAHFDAVPYGAHLLFRVIMLDPSRLYPAEWAAQVDLGGPLGLAPHSPY